MGRVANVFLSAHQCVLISHVFGYVEISEIVKPIDMTAIGQETLPITPKSNF